MSQRVPRSLVAHLEKCTSSGFTVNLLYGLSSHVTFGLKPLGPYPDNISSKDQCQLSNRAILKTMSRRQATLKNRSSRGMGFCQLSLPFLTVGIVGRNLQTGSVSSCLPFFLKPEFYSTNPHMIVILIYSVERGFLYHTTSWIFPAKCL